MVVVSGKDGDVYLLDRLNLGHWGGELWRTHVFEAESKSTPAYLKSRAGDNYVYVVGSGAPGLVGYKVVLSNNAASLEQLWLTALSSQHLGRPRINQRKTKSAKRTAARTLIPLSSRSLRKDGKRQGPLPDGRHLVMNKPTLWEATDEAYRNRSSRAIWRNFGQSENP
jgi:hypothetical protein